MFDTDSPIPFHFQIRDELKEEIAAGAYQEKVPSERELMERFSVSRTTIREAINHLVNDGIVEKIHGKGTFIKRNKQVHEWLHAIHSLTDTVNQMGMKPGSKLLFSGLVTPPDSIAAAMKQERLHLIKRLRTADGEPIAIESHYYAPELGSALERYDLHTITIYDILENDLNVTMHEAEQAISCKPLQIEEADELGLEARVNALMVDRLIKDAAGQPVEYYRSVVKPEMYVFRLKMKKQGR